MRRFVLDFPTLPPRVRTGLAWFTVVMSLTAMFVAGFALHRVGSVASEARSTAAKSCVRTKVAAPYNSRLFERLRVYPPEIQAWLEREVPTSCPLIPSEERPPKVTTPWPPTTPPFR